MLNLIQISKPKIICKIVKTPTLIPTKFMFLQYYSIMDLTALYIICFVLEHFEVHIKNPNWNNEDMNNIHKSFLLKEFSNCLSHKLKFTYIGIEYRSFNRYQYVDDPYFQVTFCDYSCLTERSRKVKF